MSVRYEARQGRVGYGIPVGILCVECNVPFIPGDVGNATSYPFPVMYHKVPGATCDAVINRKDPSLIPNFVEAAQYLVSQGVRAITGDCGYMATYQQEVADAVDVPVFLSSLLQVPLLLRILGGDRKLGVVAASDEAFTGSLLDAVGVTGLERKRLVIGSPKRKPHWREVVLEEIGYLDTDRLEAEVVQTAQEMIAEEPGLGGFLLECSELPPYSAAVHAATGLPVFDYVAFIKFVENSIAPQTFAGLY